MGTKARRGVGTVVLVVTLGVMWYVAWRVTSPNKDTAAVCGHPYDSMLWEYEGCHAGEYVWRRNRLTGTVQTNNGAAPGWHSQPAGTPFPFHAILMVP